MGLARRSLAALCLVALPSTAAAEPSFTEIGAGLTGVSSAAAVWGDYDNDGDLDLFLAGASDGGRIARIYRNTAGSFADAGAFASPPAAWGVSADWGDYDNDGDLDLAVAGEGESGVFTRIYRNNAGAMVDQALGLGGARYGAVLWADYDNDGDLDLLAVGSSGTAGVARLYRNTAGAFTEVAAGFTGMEYAAAGWADYDVDGDLDLVIGGGGTMTLYRNTSGSFAAVAGTGLPGLTQGALAWGDYDGDGDPDLAVSGYMGGFQETRIYTNAGGTFTAVTTSLDGLEDGELRWGDYDGDGDLDLAMSGGTGSIAWAQVGVNNAGVFSGGPILEGGWAPGLGWGDYDNDGDLDVALAGNSTQGLNFAYVYRSGGGAANTPPTAPTGLALSADATHVTFSWNASTDSQTPAAGLTYNLRVASGPAGATTIMPAMADLATGRRRVVQQGNTGHRRVWRIARSALVGNGVFWSVQAVDNHFAGSAFASGPSGVLDVIADFRPELRLEMRGPNPFAGEARLVFELPRESLVELAVYDPAGRRVRTLVAGRRPAGLHDARWDGDDAQGRRSRAGLYLVRLRAGGDVATHKLLRID